MTTKLNVSNTRVECGQCEVTLSLTTGNVVKNYTYLFPNKTTWEQYYYKFSYPIFDGVDRKLKLSILASIKQYRKEQ